MKTIRLAALMTIGLLVASVPEAQAALNLYYSTDGVTYTAVANDSTFTTSNGLTVKTFDSTTNAPGGTFAIDQSSTTSITNNGAGAPETVYLRVIVDGFTSPVTPPSLSYESSIGGSVSPIPGSDINSDALTFTSTVTDINGPTVLTGSPVVTSAGAYSNDQKTVISLLQAPYTIQQDVTITLGNNSSLNFSDSTSLAPVPEPMSILCLGGVLLLTSRLIMRKHGQSSRS